MSECPDELALARAHSDGLDDELAEHLEGCEACAATWDATERAIELARQVVVAMPAADRREELRTAILAASVAQPAGVAARPRGRRWWLAGAAVAAAAAVIVLAVASRGRGAEPDAHAHGTVTAHGGARYATSSRAPDEIVTLHDGTIEVEVSRLHPGERFRVIAADTEVEVRGTAFRVTAELGHVTEVVVHHGLVEVRPHGGTSVLVAAGQVFRAPVRTAVVPAVTEPAPPVAAAVPPVAAAVPPVVAVPRAPRAQVPEPAITATPNPDPAPAAAVVAVRAPAAIAYDEAWDAMRGGNFERAASTFARVAILDPDGSLAEDASYWYPVALARAKRGEALAGFRDFLGRYPRSPHAHEASAMLGWLLVEAKQPAEAARRFRAARDDANPAVRDSARAGLAALGLRD